MKKVSNSLLGSIALHIGLISLILGSAYFKTTSKPLVPTIDVDLVDIEFTSLDQDLSKVKIAGSKSKTPVSPKVEEIKPIPKPDFKDENSITKENINPKKPKSNENESPEKTLTAKSESGGANSSKGSTKVKMSYEQYLISYINRYKTYPRIAERLKQQGVVTPKLVISKDGKLKEILIDKSSGFSSLDQGAINLIKSLAPFKPLPENIKSENQIKDDEYTIKIPIGYTLIGS